MSKTRAAGVAVTSDVEAVALWRLRDILLGSGFRGRGAGVGVDAGVVAVAGEDGVVGVDDVVGVDGVDGADDVGVCALGTTAEGPTPLCGAAGLACV